LVLKQDDLFHIKVRIMWH